MKGGGIVKKKLGTRQKEILKLLFECKSGKSIAQLAVALNISRNAIRQHLSSLQRDGYVKNGEMLKTKGRPVQNYVLTESGINSFPKQYAWFTGLLLSDLKKKMGSEALQSMFYNLGESLAVELLSENDTSSDQVRLNFLLRAMDELGYQAKLLDQANSIEACNCVYHSIAQQYSEVCAFDKALIQSILNKHIELEECMALGGKLCRFKISVKDLNSKE